MKEFKETLIRHSSKVSQNRVLRMVDLLKWLCIYCIVPDVYSNNERIHHINTILPILCKFEDFANNAEYLSNKAFDIMEKAKKSVSTDPIGFKFALALNDMVNICKQGGNDKNVLLETIDITIAVLDARRSMLRKTESNQNNDSQPELTKRRKTDSIDTAISDVHDNSDFKMEDHDSLEPNQYRNN